MEADVEVVLLILTVVSKIIQKNLQQRIVMPVSNECKCKGIACLNTKLCTYILFVQIFEGRKVKPLNAITKGTKF